MQAVFLKSHLRSLLLGNPSIPLSPRITSFLHTGQSNFTLCDVLVTWPFSNLSLRQAVQKECVQGSMSGSSYRSAQIGQYSSSTRSSVSDILVTIPEMSRAVRKPAFAYAKTKSYRTADQRLCFRYTDSAILLLPKSGISSL